MTREQETAMYDQPTLPLEDLEVELEADTSRFEEALKKPSRKERKLQKRVPPIPTTHLMRLEMDSASRRLSELYRLEEEANEIMKSATEIQLNYVQWVGVKDLVMQGLRRGSSVAGAQEPGAR
jgi:hypothetical protein